jgi:hypothetical protein
VCLCLGLAGAVAVSFVTARTLQGMARVRLGQAPAWPFGSCPKAGQRLRGQGWPKSHFRRKREAPLTVEGVPPHTQRAIPGLEPKPESLHLLGCVGVLPARVFIEATARDAGAPGWSNEAGPSPHRREVRVHSPECVRHRHGCGLGRVTEVVTGSVWVFPSGA